MLCSELRRLAIESWTKSIPYVCSIYIYICMYIYLYVYYTDVYYLTMLSVAKIVYRRWQINEHGSLAECYWRWKIEVLGEYYFSTPLCPPQIPHGLVFRGTRASVVRGWRLTSWAMAMPFWASHNIWFIRLILISKGFICCWNFSLV